MGRLKKYPETMIACNIRLPEPLVRRMRERARIDGTDFQTVAMQRLMLTDAEPTSHTTDAREVYAVK